MKRILLSIFCVCSICCYSQNLSVAGVSLGDEYSRVESLLEYRYGTTFSKEHNEICYYEINIGGINYDSASFDFIYRSATRDRRLNGVFLSSHFKLSELEQAKRYRDRIAELYAKKYYDMESLNNDDGFKIYRCALNADREFFMILISLKKSVSKGGDTFYYVTVSYGPQYEESTDDI